MELHSFLGKVLKLRQRPETETETLDSPRAHSTLETKTWEPRYPFLPCEICEGVGRYMGEPLPVNTHQLLSEGKLSHYTMGT